MIGRYGNYNDLAWDKASLEVCRDGGSFDKLRAGKVDVLGDVVIQLNTKTGSTMDHIHYRSSLVWLMRDSWDENQLAVLQSYFDRREATYSAYWPDLLKSSTLLFKSSVDC
jgi:hypothetical protein